MTKYFLVKSKKNQVKLEASTTRYPALTLMVNVLCYTYPCIKMLPLFTF